ncbi:conserved hypothetical protein (plasmid) [Trichormus variabilis ATCC 29413]|uniref:DUF1392 domain-containing protein n=2 Tax=Anabaena variabilis TaxID=264691 RepID=Q3M1V4_TRIV2|nr:MULTISPECIES: DUF1392 family protein [Nostocaceae]ABA25032.1 conserved hypothetical protein [Trichormus variabilis ATCC 29413]MBC1217859.1 DUF1392 family protein [Trichormus variabilis ARAD]MBC1259151.1 DUF1392 family protein [Trichormus variabilis V5]MBC1270681.1 DUF1392 family protein [Trichormus variabilis FSR]MBC1305519.1 DUF1392 family protein [Trichormus variabilis N2B]
MTCIISELEKCWYLSPPWGKQMPPIQIDLSERVYIKATRTFGYCCGVVWQDDQWIYSVLSEHSIVQMTKYQILGTGKIQSVSLDKPEFAVGDRVLLRFSSHATKQRLVLGVVLVNGSWFYVVEMVSPTLSPALGSPIRFALVSEKDLVQVHL